jgi:alcohol dehydrogenase (cytochrome c)
MSKHETTDKPGESTLERNDTSIIPEFDVTMDMIRESASDPESWLIYGGNHQNHRHTTADVIHKGNVYALSLEYKFNVGVDPGDYQGTPLIVPSRDGGPPIMYQTNGPDHLRAINARDGEVLWHWSYDAHTTVGQHPANRGVTVVDDTIYQSTVDYGTIALDRYTGDEKWNYNAAAEYRGEEADGPIHEELDYVKNVGFASSVPAYPYDGKLFKGSFGGEWGVTGWIDAINMEDGSREWRMNTTPPERWVGDSWKHGCGNAWSPPALDPDSGTVVFPMGNPGPDFDGSVRPGWNQYTSGKLALDTDTGEPQWNYQDVPHDVWDYDSSQPPFIFEAERNGETKKFASWAGKSGWMYTVELDSGRLVTRSEAPLQKINHFMQPVFEDYENAPWFTPNIIGGTNHQPPTYDPERQIAVIKGTNRPVKVSYTNIDYKTNELYLALDEWALAPGDEDIEGWNNNKGYIAGIDPISGNLEWRIWRNESPWGGLMTTSTGLTFAGTAEGELLALDTETGKELWSHDLGPGLGGDPVSWYDPGTDKQYVAIQGGGDGTLGGYGDNGDLLAVFSLSG